jgi:methylphosphotriester-DNA--protein-cysteine methyltransferase
MGENGTRRAEGGGMMVTSCARCRAFPVLDWLATKSVYLRPAPAYLVRHVFEHPAQYREWGEVLAALSLSAATPTMWMKKKRLPAPGRWLQAARALRAVAAIRTHPELTIQRIAIEIGYDDHSGISHAVSRSFGIRASDCRQRLDPVVLMDAWWTLHTPRVAAMAAA